MKWILELFCEKLPDFCFRCFDGLRLCLPWVWQFLVITVIFAVLFGGISMMLIFGTMRHRKRIGLRQKSPWIKVAGWAFVVWLIICVTFYCVSLALQLREGGFVLGALASVYVSVQIFNNRIMRLFF